ncbi:hypothetical protein KBA73_04070 [Patescibacteria group bacterium]|nr:hypothetical protein [Patescibacteria group bacterium]
MENEINIQTPIDSVISAYGVASWKRFLPFYLISGGIALTLLLVIGFFWSLAAPITLPAEIAFIGVLTPATVNTILKTEEARTELPLAWRAQIETRSRWPALFGAARIEDKWQFFVITPRWSLPQVSFGEVKKYRLVGVISLPDDAPGQTTSYFTWMRRGWKHPSAQAQVDIYPAIIASEAIPYQKMPPFSAILYRDRILTNLTAPPANDRPLTENADILLRLDPTTTSTWRESFFEILPIGRADLASLEINPAEIFLNYSTSGTISSLAFQTQHPMSPLLKTKLLAAVGFSKKAAVALPDGSILTEQRLPNEEELRATSTYQTPYGEVELTDSRFELNRLGARSVEAFSSCSEGSLIGRLSAQAVRQFLSALDLSFLASDRGIQLYQQDGQVFFCRE